MRNKEKAAREQVMRAKVTDLLGRHTGLRLRLSTDRPTLTQETETQRAERIKKELDAIYGEDKNT